MSILRRIHTEKRVDTHSPSLDSLAVDEVREDTTVGKDLRERGRRESDEGGEGEHLWPAAGSLRRVRSGSRACRTISAAPWGFISFPALSVPRLPSLFLSTHLRPMSRVPAGGLPLCLASNDRRPNRALRDGTRRRMPRPGWLDVSPRRIFSGCWVTDAYIAQQRRSDWPGTHGSSCCISDLRSSGRGRMTRRGCYNVRNWQVEEVAGAGPRRVGISSRSISDV